MSTQTTKTLEQKVIALAGSQAGMPTEKITLDCHFEADLGYDSLDQVEFLMTIEEEFDIEVGEEQASTIMTVRNAVEAIQKLTV